MSPSFKIKKGCRQSGNAKRAKKADISVAKKSEMILANLSSHELIAKWRDGSQDAAALLMDRYRLRLIALVASRISKNREYLIDPEDVVQSAMGSFFRSASPQSPSRLQIDTALSVWNLLAVFARRKLSRSLTRMDAAKRGAGWSRQPVIDFASLEEIAVSQLTDGRETKWASELMAEFYSTITPDQMKLLELLLHGYTQKEVATKLAIDERTVRRRIKSLRESIEPTFSVDRIDQHQSGSISPATIEMPYVSYSEFVLGKLIGRGGFGKVYQARMQSDGSFVAVKFMHRDLWSDEIAKQAFLREIDQASRIDHPGILNYLGWGESPHGGPYILSELVDGLPLNRIRNQTTTDSIEVLRQVCEAISEAHTNGVVHGDLTPQNILIAREGRIVITDFGLSTSFVRSPDLLESLNTSRGGTVGYAAPEQVSPAFGTIGPWTDVYAIGALAYFFLNGSAPHTKENVTVSLVDTIDEQDVSLLIEGRTSDLQPSSALEKLKRVASMALRKAVSDRPHDVQSLLDLLHEFN